MLEYKPHDVSLSKLAGRRPCAATTATRCSILTRLCAEDVLNEETFGAETGGEALGTHTSL